MSNQLSVGALTGIQDIFEKPKFYVDDATATDVRQGNHGDCYFLAALCALSNKKGLIDRVCVHRDEQVGVYGFVFHRGMRAFKVLPSSLT